MRLAEVLIRVRGARWEVGTVGGGRSRRLFDDAWAGGGERMLVEELTVGG
jgi:hypothetical protein